MRKLTLVAFDFVNTGGVHNPEWLDEVSSFNESMFVLVCDLDDASAAITEHIDYPVEQTPSEEIHDSQEKEDPHDA